MLLFRHHDHLPEEARNVVVALGNFDGLHRGHQAVIGTAARLARAQGLKTAVLTFEPHPRAVFGPATTAFRLTPFRTKVRLLESLNVDILFVLPFNPAFARVRAKDFVDHILIRNLQTRHVVVGYDFVFGHKRQGTTDFLAGMAAARGMGFTCVDPFADESRHIVSSSRIRRLLTEGRPEQASALLGRPWELEGRVIHGQRTGRTLGFPTANLALDDFLFPALGVYAVLAGVDQGEATQWGPGVANIGRRPTVRGEDVRLETHLLDFEGDLYGRHLRVRMMEYLRPERRFDGLEALRDQIAVDVASAREKLRRYQRG